MKRLILVLVLVAAALVGLSFYMGWFRLSSGNAESKANVTLSLDKEKLQSDKDNVVNEVKDLVGRAKE